MNDLHERSASVADHPAQALSSGRAAPATSGAPTPVSTRDSGTPDLVEYAARYAELGFIPSPLPANQKPRNRIGHWPDQQGGRRDA